MSAFRTRIYDLDVILAAPDAAPLWQWEEWRHAMTVLDPLVSAARGKPGLRVTQLGPGPGSPNARAIKHGRLAWNAASAERWTHGSPQTREVSDGWTFMGASLWCPGPNACDREGMPPDVFVVVRREDDARFDVLIAVATDLVALGAARATAANALSARTRATGHTKTSRPWVTDGGSLTDCEVYGASYALRTSRR